MVVGGSPRQGKSASFIWAPHACQPVWMPLSGNFHRGWRKTSKGAL